MKLTLGFCAVLLVVLVVAVVVFGSQWVVGSRLSFEVGYVWTGVVEVGSPSS
jgi:hypothetical protein